MSSKPLAQLAFFVLTLVVAACGDKIRLANNPTPHDSLGLMMEKAKSTRALESLVGTTTWIGKCVGQSRPHQLSIARLTVERSAAGLWIDSNENGFSTTLVYSAVNDIFEGKTAYGERTVTLKGEEVAPRTTAILMTIKGKETDTQCYFEETKNERAKESATEVEKAIGVLFAGN